MLWLMKALTSILLLLYFIYCIRLLVCYKHLFEALLFLRLVKHFILSNKLGIKINIYKFIARVLLHKSARKVYRNKDFK